MLLFWSKALSRKNSNISTEVPANNAQVMVRSAWRRLGAGSFRGEERIFASRRWVERSEVMRAFMLNTMFMVTGYVPRDGILHGKHSK